MDKHYTCVLRKPTQRNQGRYEINKPGDDVKDMMMYATPKGPKTYA